MSFSRILCLCVASMIFGQSQVAECAEATYSHKASGITLTIPKALSHDKKASRDKPLSVAFRFGKPPFACTVLFKQVSDKLSLKDWLKEERARWKKGKYEKEMTEKAVKLGGQAGVKLIRRSAIGEIHYLVFASPKDKKLYALWHMTSKTADPKKACVAAMAEMAKSMKFSK